MITFIRIVLIIIVLYVAIMTFPPYVEWRLRNYKEYVEDDTGEKKFEWQFSKFIKMLKERRKKRNG